MSIFMVGVTVTREQGSDVIVRVEAEDELAARKLAREIVRQRCNTATRSSDLVSDDSCWQFGAFSVEGDSREDYTRGYTPDIDLVES